MVKVILLMLVWYIAFTAKSTNPAITNPLLGVNETEEVSANTSFYRPAGTAINQIEAFQLTGNMIVPPYWKKLKKVATSLVYDPNLIPSINYSGSGGWKGFIVTTKTFDVPIPVQLRQEVSATVRISFE